MKLEKLLVVAVSCALLLGGGLAVLGLSLPHPAALRGGQILMGVAMALACFPLVALLVQVLIESLRGRRGR